MDLTTRVAFLPVLAMLGALAFQTSAAQEGGYGLNPGDVLQISVWKEEELTRDVLVRPDGKISFPLVGDVMAAGGTPEALQQAIAERLTDFLADPVVTVAVASVPGLVGLIILMLAGNPRAAWIARLVAAGVLLLGWSVAIGYTYVGLLHLGSGAQRASETRDDVVDHARDASAVSSPPPTKELPDIKL